MFHFFFLAVFMLLNTAPAQALPWGTEAWTKRCEKRQEPEGDYCEIFQRLAFKETRQRLVEFALGFQNSNIASGILVLPLGVAIQPGVRVSIDDKPEYRTASIEYCIKDGCYARVELGRDMLDNMRRGKDLVLHFQNNEGKNIEVKLSLSGFSEALRGIGGR